MKKVILFFVLIAIPFLAAECFFNSQAADAPALSVSEAYAFSTLKGTTTGAAYLEVTNKGKAAAVIVGAETPVAARTELHDHVHEDGVMRMRQLETLTIAPGETKSFEPGGLHVMFFEMNRQLEAGSEFPLSLITESGGKLMFTVKVEERE